ncbi:Amino acid transporters [Phaffia rhodozyma]|uniref:Amino acid transporters n=1 Tax=Phaffia rhodozyma TaxID=264483 RepID=A0A0F7SXP9_PHARH|nr:Amino acid transporters [Phaffia rhodozyma]
MEKATFEDKPSAVEPSTVYAADVDEDSVSPTPLKDTEKGTEKNTAYVRTHDVFEVNESGPDFRGVSWFGAVVLLTKQQIGLGVLSLPKVLNTLGMVPGMLIILFIAAMATFGSVVIGKFGQNHPGVHTMGDVGFIIAGVFGRELFGWGFWLLECFSAASGILATSIALNAISDHGTCTIVFVVVAAVVIGLGASPRTFKQISWLGYVGICSILPAIFIATIAVGVADRPPNAPAGPYDKRLRAIGDCTLVEGLGAIINVLFAYAGSAGFLPVISEMRNPKGYTSAVLTCQLFSTALYVSVASVLWYYCGQYIASPALGSAGPLIKKIAYGVAIPGLLAGPIIYAHLSTKFCFVRILRGTRHLQESTAVHWFTWLGLIVSIIAFCFVIAEVVPFFDELIGLVGAVFASMFSILIPGLMWLYDNHNEKPNGSRTLRNKIIYMISAMMMVVGFALLVLGLYASVENIKNAFAAGSVGSPFTCADNSKTTTSYINVTST